MLCSLLTFAFDRGCVKARDPRVFGGSLPFLTSRKRRSGRSERSSLAGLLSNLCFYTALLEADVRVGAVSAMQVPVQ